MASDAPIFRRRALVWLVVVGATAFCLMITALVAGDPTANVTKSSVFSRSALGHNALAELLRKQGHDVRINRDRRAAHVGDGNLLLLLEPDAGQHALDHLGTMLLDAIVADRPVLLALPKRRGSESQEQRGWIDRSWTWPPERAAKVLHALDALRSASVVRLEDETFGPAWRTSLGGAVPSLETPQLVEHPELEPLVAAGDQILLGLVAATRVLVLADPDLLANHGLRQGANAEVVLAAIELLLPGGGAVVFDETLHGFAIVPSLWRLLFLPPYLAATALALGAAGLVVWRAAARFGAPLQAMSGPVFRGGHATLIDNAGRLLTAGGHEALVAERYGEATVREALARLHLIRHVGANADAVEALNAVAKRRGVHTRLPAADGARGLRPLALARRYQRWTREMFGES